MANRVILVPSKQCSHVYYYYDPTKHCALWAVPSTPNPKSYFDHLPCSAQNHSFFFFCNNKKNKLLIKKVKEKRKRKQHPRFVQLHYAWERTKEPMNAKLFVGLMVGFVGYLASGGAENSILL